MSPCQCEENRKQSHGGEQGESRGRLYLFTTSVHLGLMFSIPGYTLRCARDRWINLYAISKVTL